MREVWNYLHQAFSGACLFNGFVRYGKSQGHGLASPFLDTQSCLEAFEMAIIIGIPLIMNSDQGSQFTSSGWVEAMTRHGMKISMNGKGRCLGNITIERFWRSVKYEEVPVNLW